MAQAPHSHPSQTGSSESPERPRRAAQPLLQRDLARRARPARGPGVVKLRGRVLADEAQVPGLVLVAGLGIDGHGVVPARGAARAVLPVVGIDGVGQHEAEGPRGVVEPASAGRAAEAVAEDGAGGGPVRGEHVDRRAQLVLAVAGQGALRGGLAEAAAGLGGPAVEDPALGAEAAERRLDAAGYAGGLHGVEHGAQGDGGVAAQACVGAVALAGGAGRQIADVDEIARGVVGREGAGGGAVDEGEQIVAVDEGEASVGRGEEGAEGAAGEDDGAGVLRDGGGGTEGEGRGGGGGGGSGGRGVGRGRGLGLGGGGGRGRGRGGGKGRGRRAVARGDERDGGQRDRGERERSHHSIW